MQYFSKKWIFLEKRPFFAKIVKMVKNGVLRVLAKKVGQNSSRVYGRLPRWKMVIFCLLRGKMSLKSDFFWLLGGQDTCFTRVLNRGKCTPGHVDFLRFFRFFDVFLAFSLAKIGKIGFKNWLFLIAFSPTPHSMTSLV